MTTLSGLEVFELSEIEDFDIACDYNDDHWLIVVEHGPASWIAKARCLNCGNGGTRLICTSCRDLIIATPDGVGCGRCGEVVVPARKAYTSFEPLDRKKVR